MIKTEIFTLESHSKNPVVLLHSSLSNGQQWSSLTPSFENSSAPDLLGYGQNTLPDIASASFSLSDEIQALQGKLYSRPFHLVGHSFGAATALQVARHFPEQVLSLSLFEPVAFHLLPEHHPAIATILDIQTQIDRLLSENRTDAATEFFIDYWNQAGTFKDLSDKTRTRFVQGIQKVSMDFCALMNEASGLTELQHIQCPVLLLEGQYSTDTAHAVVSALQSIFPDAEKHRLACGHMGPVTHADLVNPIVSQFIATHKKA